MNKTIKKTAVLTTGALAAITIGSEALAAEEVVVPENLDVTSELVTVPTSELESAKSNVEKQKESLTEAKESLNKTKEEIKSLEKALSGSTKEDVKEVEGDLEKIEKSLEEKSKVVEPVLENARVQSEAKKVAESKAKEAAKQVEVAKSKVVEKEEEIKNVVVPNEVDTTGASALVTTTTSRVEDLERTVGAFVEDKGALEKTREELKVAEAEQKAAQEVYDKDTLMPKRMYELNDEYKKAYKELRDSLKAINDLENNKDQLIYDSYDDFIYNEEYEAADEEGKAKIRKEAERLVKEYKKKKEELDNIFDEKLANLKKAERTQYDDDKNAFFLTKKKTLSKKIN